MTVQQLVLSMFNVISMLVAEEDYRLLRLSKRQILKRNKFSSVCRTLRLYLIRLSIPGAFPEKATEIINRFDESFELAYRDYPASKERIEAIYKAEKG